VIEMFREKLHTCKALKDEEKKSRCLWELIQEVERFICNEVRKELPLRSDLEAIASDVIEKNAVISWEIAKNMKQGKPKYIDFAYIHEKEERLRRSIDDLAEEIMKAYSVEY